MSEYSIGVDLGGTNLRAAAIDARGKMVDKIAGSTELKAGRDVVIDDMVKSIEALRARLGEHNLRGVGIGLPGFILIDKGIIIGSNNMPEFEDYPVRDEIERRLGAKVILENDANAAALGEKWMGAGREVDDLVLLTLGTGIGGGIIVGRTGAARTARNGGRAGPHDGGPERQSVRLRQSGLRGEARLGDCDRVDGAADRAGSRSDGGRCLSGSPRRGTIARRRSSGRWERRWAWRWPI